MKIITDFPLPCLILSAASHHVTSLMLEIEKRTSGEQGHAQYHQQNKDLNSQRHKNQDQEKGAVGCLEFIEVDCPLCSSVAVDSRTGVFAVMCQVLELLGDAVVRVGDRGEVAGVGTGPCEGRCWFTLGGAVGFEGVIPIGTDSNVNDPGGSCGNYRKYIRFQ